MSATSSVIGCRGAARRWAEPRLAALLVYAIALPLLRAAARREVSW